MRKTTFLMRRRAGRWRVVRLCLCMGLLACMAACTRETAPPASQAPAPAAQAPAGPHTKGQLPAPPPLASDTLELAAFQAKFDGLKQPTSLNPRIDFTPEKLKLYPHFGRLWLRMAGGRLVEVPLMDFHGLFFRHRNPRLYEMLSTRSVPDGVMVYLHTFDGDMQPVATQELARYWARDLSRIEKTGYFTDVRNYTSTYTFYENYTLTDSVISNLLILDDGQLKVMGESVY